MRMRIWLAGALLLAAALAACASEPPPTRQEVVAGAVDGVIMPRYQDVAAKMNGLRASLNALCAAPSQDGLAAARAAWRDARAPWMRSQAMWFGPVMDRRSRSIVDWHPIEPDAIEERIGRGAITATDVREFLPSTQRGLGAVEHILFQNGDPDADVVAALAGDAARCAYLTAAGDAAADETDAVLAEWAGTGADGADGGYAGFFSGRAADSLISKSALDELVRTSVFMSRSIADMRLGKALGVDGQTPDWAALPGGAGNNGVADIRNQLLGMRDIYLGATDGGTDGGGTDGGADGGGLGVSALTRGVSPDADDRMRAAFQAALDAVDGLQEPLGETLRADPQPGLDAYAAVKELQTRLNTEVVSLLGITVGFADTDGDGG